MSRSSCYFALLVLISGPVWAETMYQTKSGCENMPAYRPADDVNAVDGKGAHGEAVPPANLGEAHPIHKQLEYIDIPVEIPLENHLDTSKYNADLSDTRIRPGTITVDTSKGETRFNGVNLSEPPLYNPDCVRDKGSIYSTK